MTNERIEDLRVLSISQTAKHLGISTRQVWRLIQNREIESVLLSTRRRGITQSALVDFIKERTVPKFNPSDAIG